MTRNRDIVRTSKSAALGLALAALSACAPTDEEPAVYRNLSDIPARPQGSHSQSEREADVKMLEADRARAAQAAEVLRDEAKKMAIPSAPASGT